MSDDQIGNKQKNQKIGLCVYCGFERPITQEHVIPTCLFKVTDKTPKPTDPVTVGACEVCNGSKSQDDDYLRDMLVLDNDCSDSAIAQAIFRGKFIRSHRKNRSILGRSAILKARLVPVNTRGGIYIGHLRAVPLDQERFDRIFSTLVRGLYYWVTEKRIPDDCQFNVLRVMRIDFPQYWKDVTCILNEFPNQGSVGNDVFECRYFISSIDPTVTFWLLCFYRGYFVRVTTQSPDSYSGLPSQ